MIIENQDDAPVLCACTEPLHYLSMPHEEAVAEYLSLIPKHCDSRFFADKRVHDFLTSDLCLGGYVPMKWTGIRDLVVHLKTREACRHASIIMT